MAIRGMKIIKNGKTTYAPWNAATVNFYNERNNLVKKSKNRDQEIVTIIEATPEEVQEFLMPAAPRTVTPFVANRAAAPAVAENAEYEKLKKENKSLEERMAKLEKLLAKQTEPASSENEEEAEEQDFQSFDDAAEVQPKPKKAGRPAKNK